MFERIGHLVVRRRWWVILAWVIAAIALVAFAPKFKASTQQTDFLPGHYESVKAFNLADEAFPQEKGRTAFIVVTRKDGAALTAPEEKQIGLLAGTLQNKHIKGVQSIVPGAVSANHKAALVEVRFRSADYGDSEVSDGVKTIRDDIAAAGVPSAFTVYVTGDAADEVDSTESSEKSDQITLLATVIVIFVLLIFTFRSVVAALLPLLTVALVLVVALALVGTVNKVFDLKGDATTQSLMPIVLFGVGTDYILFLLFRYRERLRMGEDPRLAMTAAVHRVGEVIASAAAAVIIAFGALILASLGMLKSMGPAMGIAVATTLVAALTLIPAVISLLGPKVFWPSKAWQTEPEHNTSARLGRLIGRRPVAVTVGAGAVLVALSIGALGFSADFDMVSAPASTDSAKGLKEMNKGFPPGQRQVTQVYVHSTDGRPLPAGAAQTVADRLKTVKGVGGVTAPVASADRTASLVEVQLASDPLSKTAMKAIEGPVRDAAHAAAPAGTAALVGGQTSIMVDLQSSMNRDYVVVFPIAGLLIAIILGLLLRSLVAPVYLMIAVVLSFLGTIGMGVLVFQGLEGHTGVIFFLPLIVYLFVVALGTDYNILMIARLREEARAGHPPREGVANAFQHTAPTVASAGLILAGSFSTFLLADSDALQEMGVSVALGVILSAFVMSMFLVPAVTVLLGHAAWWPGHQDEPDQAQAAEEEPVVRV